MPAVPRHEAEQDQATLSEFLYTLRHPSRTSTFVRELIEGARAYYAAEDVAALDRRELIELLSYTRRIAIKMGACALCFDSHHFYESFYKVMSSRTRRGHYMTRVM